MKAYYNIAQAYHALRDYDSALKAAEMAREHCIKDMPIGGKGLVGSGKSLPLILELGLRCRKEGWEKKEERRRRDRGYLLGEVTGLMRREMEKEGGRKEGYDGEGNGDAMDIDTKEITEEWEKKIEEVERVFRLVETQGKEGRRREMPDWAIDGISFNVMIDPVVVCFFIFRILYPRPIVPSSTPFIITIEKILTYFSHRPKLANPTNAQVSFSISKEAVPIP